MGLSNFIVIIIYAVNFYAGTSFMEKDKLPYDKMLLAMFAIIFAAFGAGFAQQFMPDVGKCYNSAA